MKEAIKIIDEEINKIRPQDYENMVECRTLNYLKTKLLTSNRFEQQVIPKIAEVYIMKIDEYCHLTEDISLPCEITFGGSLKIYVEENGKISQAVNGWGNKADEFIGRKIEIFQKIKSNFSE